MVCSSATFKKAATSSVFTSSVATLPNVSSATTAIRSLDSSLSGSGNSQFCKCEQYLHRYRQTESSTSILQGHPLVPQRNSFSSYPGTTQRFRLVQSGVSHKFLTILTTHCTYHRYGLKTPSCTSRLPHQNAL